MAFIVQLWHVHMYICTLGRPDSRRRAWPHMLQIGEPLDWPTGPQGGKDKRRGGCESLIGAAFDSAGLMDRQRLRRGSKVAARLVAPAPPRQALETPEEAAEAQECRERHKNVAGRAGQRYQLAVSPRRDPTAMATILRAVSGGMCRVID